MSYIPIGPLISNYGDIRNLFHNTHNQKPFLVYSFYLIDSNSSHEFKIENPGWLQIQESGKTYRPLRAHPPRKRGAGYVQTGLLIDNSNLLLFRTKEKAEEYIQGYLNNQKIAAQLSYEFFNNKIDYLSKLTLP